MRRYSWPVLAAVVVLAVLAGCSGPSEQTSEPCREQPLQAGDPAPELVLTGPGGEKEVSVQEIADGRVALVDVWATWCKPCIEAMPHLEELHAKYSNEGFTVIGIMSDGNAAKRGPEWVEQHEVSYPMLFDENSERLSCQWGRIIGYPTIFLLDQNGTIAEVIGGTGDVSKLDERVAELVSDPGSSAAGAAK